MNTGLMTMEDSFHINMALSAFFTESKRKSRSSGLFEPGREEIDLSPVVGFDAQLRHSPVSPIPFGDLSTDDKEDVHPRFEDSPGFSPVRPVKTQIRKILRKSQEESYIQGTQFSEYVKLF